MTAVDQSIFAETKLKDQHQAMKDLFNAEPYPSYATRKDVLTKLKKSIIANEQNIYDALKKDYGYRSEFDTLMTDILSSVGLINYSLKRLKKWMKPSKRHAGILLAPSTVRVHYQPLGVVGVITPWNFPFFLSLGPALQALAAGNKVMIKMSEFTPNASAALRKVISGLEDHIIIVEGQANVGAAFSKLPFDHLIFTGSTTVGKLVAKAAAENLTPITLEMGGKSPTIVAKDANITAAVDAILLGKMTNSGQICVAPDYVFVPEGKKQEFIDTFKARYTEFYAGKEHRNNQTHIVSERQHQRLKDFIVDAKSLGADIDVVNDPATQTERLVYPHLVTNITEEMKVMKEEIFGSLLPIMTYTDIEDVIKYINDRPRPLALYLMSNNSFLINHVIQNTHSGGISINDTAMHVMADDAPFGGVGPSGLGHYHGHEGFLTFSKAKTVLHSKSWIPRNKFLMKHRDKAFKALRFAFLR